MMDIIMDQTFDKVDFAEDYRGVSEFEECDLSSAIFNSTNLEGADFSTARNYTINPQSNRVKNAKFSLPDVVGLLANLDIKIEQR